jgi:hypothetical protein
MMVVAIMQPYFFPYIGYFQLMAACDLFIVRDDVQYIQGGWINRNRILVANDAHWITMPVADADHRQPINQRAYLLDDRLAQRVRRQIVAAYRGAPYFDDTIRLVDEALGCRIANVAAFNTHLLHCVAQRLGIDTPLQAASTLRTDDSLAGQDAVIDICLQLGATRYINPIGGVELYDAASFARRGVNLRFLECTAAAYAQFGAAPVPSLSVIDVMMFNDTAAVRHMLEAYRLVADRSARSAAREVPLS